MTGCVLYALNLCFLSTIIMMMLIFFDALSEHWFVHNVSFEALSEKVYNPFELNSKDRINLPIDYIDPDLQFFNDYNALYSSVNPEYFIEDTINKHFAELENNLTNIHHEFTIIVLSETWFNDITIDRYRLQGYCHEFEYRKQRRGGGASLFIRGGVGYKIRNDLSFFGDDFESLFVELSNIRYSFGKSVIFYCIYRPPNTDIRLFTDQNYNILDILRGERKVIYLAGDYNINILNSDKHKPCAEFLEKLSSYSLCPLINRHTRINSSSASLIDNIFSNAMNYKLLSGLLCTDINDHLPIFVLDQTKEMTTSPTMTKYRQ